MQAEFRSQGIGKQLLNHIKQNHSSLSLDVYSSNKLAVRFYKREGFTIADEHIAEDTGFMEYRMEYTCGE